MGAEGPVQLAELYARMCRAREVEQSLAWLWERGLITGELHPGVGEEAVAAGVVAHLRDGDAMALDYRGTPPLVARGVDLESLFLEMLGSDDGLCGGRAGHMHLMSVPLRSAASGIVGAPGPLACGFGLAAAQHRRSEVAVAFFGDGAVNEGMLMEALNLAMVWRLPVVFVCKDNGWAVTTRTGRLTGGGLKARARGFGLPVVEVNGADVVAVWRGAGRAVAAARRGRGPTFLLAHCRRPGGHVAGDPIRQAAVTARDLAGQVGPLLAVARTRPGAPLGARAAALASIGARIGRVGFDAAAVRADPLRRAARRLGPSQAEPVAAAEHEAVHAALQRALHLAGVGADD